MLDLIAFSSKTTFQKCNQQMLSIFACSYRCQPHSFITRLLREVSTPLQGMLGSPLQPTWDLVVHPLWRPRQPHDFITRPLGRSFIPLSNRRGISQTTPLENPASLLAHCLCLTLISFVIAQGNHQQILSALPCYVSLSTYLNET